MAQYRIDWLSPDDPPPVATVPAAGDSPFLLIGDHAGIAVPARLGSLGVSAADMARHIACDIGVRGLGEALARMLGAAFIHQSYSRLVIDCNRDPRSPEAIPAVSDGTLIPGNQAIAPDEAAARIAAIHNPYQDAIKQAIAPDKAMGNARVLVSLHSFTPIMQGFERPWEIGVLHGGGDERFAIAMLDVLQARGGIVVGDNEPYRMDGTDHTVPRHAFATAMPYVEIEVRQDLIGDPAGQDRWAGIIAEALTAAFSRI
ncbi:N-formylglutamate amidohydrolase [Sphingobium phenoxybenzoativorans]|uniref:N-formylglutamate amidohydrolase n=1 Tax=Sphingobium phenoxybenzoativorans TaxID=1592790 RepID=A0A975K7M8_9SPHN|nr:N-formylglutamate amidohydrolase [Sphingobium phenoxybenzoativorans]QUT06260.1 N-formylglutamate amidohydrolase [Sphingobium phenoxybenzoativorans]